MRNVTVQPERPPHGRFHERHPTACPLPSGQAAMTLATILNVSLFVHIQSSTICCLKYINTSAPINCTVNFLHVHTDQIVLLGKYFNILWCRRQKKKTKNKKRFYIYITTWHCPCKSVILQRLNTSRLKGSSTKVIQTHSDALSSKKKRRRMKNTKWVFIALQLHGIARTNVSSFFSSSDCLMLDPLNQYVWACLFETSLCLRSKKQTVRNIRINVSLDRHLLGWAIVSAGVSAETVTQRRCIKPQGEKIDLHLQTHSGMRKFDTAHVLYHSKHSSLKYFKIKPSRCC